MRGLSITIMGILAGAKSHCGSESLNEDMNNNSHVSSVKFTYSPLTSLSIFISYTKREVEVADCCKFNP